MKKITIIENTYYTRDEVAEILHADKKTAYNRTILSKDMSMFKNLSNAAEIVAKSLNTATQSMENFGICIYRSGK